MKRDLVHFARRERRRLISLGIEIGIVLGIFGVAVMIGPFGTFPELDLSARAAYWGIIIVINWAQLRVADILLRRVLGDERFWLTTVAASLVAAVPATFEVIWLETTFRPQNVPEISFLSLYPQVLTLTLAIMVPVTWFFLGRARRAELAEALQSAAPKPAPGTAFLKRVPVALGKDLHAIQAEDHYVRVFTAIGDDLILHRFSDALVEIEGCNGMQVHRSWWVAEQGLADVNRRDRKVFLVLKNGAEVPVSRTHMARVRDAGWLA